jgi:hypothetical protein
MRYSVLIAVLLCVSGAAWTEEVRGAPLGAAPPAPVETEEAPKLPSDLAESEWGEPLRTIPDEQWQFLKETEEQAGKPIETRKGTFLRVPFSKLSSFDYHDPAPYTARTWEAEGGAPKERIPEEVRDLDGGRVMIAGFMVPLAFDRRGNVEAFALSQDLLFCCYGIPPAMNEWIMITVESGVPVTYMKDTPIAVFGKLDVGEQLDDGFVLSMYRMEAVEVTDLREAVRRSR